MHDVLRYTFNLVVNPSLCVNLYGAEWMNANKLCVSTEGGRGPCSVRYIYFISYLCVLSRN